MHGLGFELIYKFVYFVKGIADGVWLLFSNHKRSSELLESVPEVENLVISVGFADLLGLIEPDLVGCVILHGLVPENQLHEIVDLIEENSTLKIYSAYFGLLDEEIHILE